MHLSKGEIAVIGLGYVGLPLAILARKKGYKVVGIDRNIKVIKDINNDKCPFGDKDVENNLKKFHIQATEDIQTIKGVNTIIVCVPTPVEKNGKPNLEPIVSSFTSIGRYLEMGQLVVLESTVNPGVTKDIIIPILEKVSGLVAGKDFYIAHCPERIDPGSRKWNVENLPRVVGSLEKVGLQKAATFYSSILKAPVKLMQSIEEAEAVKILENCFRDVNIALINEFARSFAILGIDIVHVIEGASGKPFSFLAHYPSCGVGGHCIPVDPYYMIEYAKSGGFDHKLLRLARKINNDMPEYTVDLAIQGLKHNKINIKNAGVTILGLSYKKNIADIRESPSFKIISLLKKKGIAVKSYDPYVLDKSSALSLEDALYRTNAVIIAVDHHEFISLNPKILLDNNIFIMIDGKNCLNKEKFTSAGIYYKGVGR